MYVVTQGPGVIDHANPGFWAGYLMICKGYWVTFKMGYSSYSTPIVYLRRTTACYDVKAVFMLPI